MKKVITIVFSVMLLLPVTMKADEGLWFLMFIERLNYQNMQKMGLRLTAEEIYSVNNNSLKDAVIMFNSVNSGAVISKNGLVITNQAGGYNAIAKASAATNNILKDGFWAKNSAEEKYLPDLSVRFFVKMGDCTTRIMSKVQSEMSELEREKVIRNEIEVITKENNSGGAYTVAVKSFYEGNEYYYFIYKDYNDIRLVGLPPENLAQFGGDTDNWEWPRHAGNFSLFRIYGDLNGNPASFSKDNIPLGVNKFLTVNAKGVKEGDFTMIMGYPSKTNRWAPAAAIKQNQKFVYPACVEILNATLYYMQKYIDMSEDNKLLYATKYADLQTMKKQKEGLLNGLHSSKTVNVRELQEANFDTWANGPPNKKKFGNITPAINLYYNLTNTKSRHDNYLGMMLKTSAFASISTTLGAKLKAYIFAEQAEKAKALADFKEMTTAMYEELLIPTEKDILAAQLKIYATKSAGYKIAPTIDDIGAQFNNDFTEYVNQLFDASLFTSKEKIEIFLQNPTAEVLFNDPLYLLSEDLNKHLLFKSDEIISAQHGYTAAYRLMVDGMRTSKTSLLAYPDGNGTMRLSYGKVKALPNNIENNVPINNHTNFEGQIKKHLTGGRDFVLPSKIVELFYKKQNSNYFDTDGSLHINFLTDNDIVIGNAGSPVLNNKGELIGISFDGNSEAIAGDMIFDPQLQRSINLDIRYVLWIIENSTENTYIINDLKIIN